MPTASQVSLSKGSWFVFPLGSKTVRAWGSSISGLERIYVDETVVSERRSAGRISVHDFAIDGAQHAVTFNTKGRLRTQLECTLTKSGVPIKTFLATLDKSTAFSPRRLILSAIAGALVGVAGIYFHLPLWAIIALLAVVILVQSKSRKRSGVKVEEVAAREQHLRGASAVGPRGSHSAC